ncbi:MAG: dockerin [Byssovorax sp.]
MIRPAIAFSALSLVSLLGCGPGTLGGSGGASASTGETASGSGGSGGLGASSASVSSGSSGTGGGGPTITPAPFDWIGIVSTGQSLSVGATGTPVVSTTQPYNNLMLSDASPDPKYDGVGDMLSLVPLIAPMKVPAAGGPAYPDNIAGETPSEGTSNQISALTKALGGFDTVSVASNVGESGQSITVIKKGGTGKAFASTLYEGAAIKALAGQQGKSFGYGAILLTHGETDAGDVNYLADITQLSDDYNTDLKALTGQKQDIPMLISQQGTFPQDANSYAQSTLAEWQLGVVSPGKFLCVGPKYQYEYSADHVHFPAPQYRRLGEKYGEVYVRAILMKEPWAPLQPTKVSRNGAVITVDFHVPDPPLAWEDAISSPHQEIVKAWAAGRGFEVSDSSGVLTIEGVAIAGSSVVVTLTAPPPGQGLTLSYALIQDKSGYSGGTDNGRRGQLRDSDPFIGYDAQTIACTVVQGSTTITAAVPGGFDQRSITDVVTDPGAADDTVVMSRSGDTLTLSHPWKGASGAVMAGFHADQRNYGVQFALPVP